ncbi:MAG: hypothetical protein KDC49_17855 [Saprospiraceae bacterium]|nr:hypothetical protein [Saprospiraceae bacterium]
MKAQNTSFSSTEITNIPHSQFHFVYEDNDRIIWLGTSTELIRFDGQNAVNIRDIYPEISFNGPVFKIIEDQNYKYVACKNSHCIYALPKHKISEKSKSICLQRQNIEDVIVSKDGSFKVLSSSNDSIFIDEYKNDKSRSLWQGKLEYPYRRPNIIETDDGFLVVDIKKITLINSDGNPKDELILPNTVIPFAESNLTTAVYKERIFLAHQALAGIWEIKIEQNNICLLPPSRAIHGQVGDMRFDHFGHMVVAWKDPEGFMKRISVFQDLNFEKERSIELKDKSLQSLDAYDAMSRIGLGGYFNLKIITLSNPYFKNFLSAPNFIENQILEAGISMRGVVKLGGKLYFLREVNTVYEYDPEKQTVRPLDLRETNGQKVELRCTNDLLYSPTLDKLIVASCSKTVGVNHIFIIDYKTGICEKVTFDIRIQTMAFNPKNNNEIFFGYSEHSNGVGSFDLFSKTYKLLAAQNSKDTYFLRFIDNRFWVGTKKGLLVLDSNLQPDKKFNELSALIGINEIYHISEKNNTVFVGTASKGLFIYDKITGKTDICDSKSGLTSNAIASAIVDDYGYLWIATFNGLNVFDQKGDLIKVYTQKDGTNHNEYNRYSFFDAGDKIYFGSINGMLEVDLNGFLKDVKYNPKTVYVQKIVYQLSDNKTNVNQYYQATPEVISYPKNSIDLRIQMSDRISLSKDPVFRGKLVGYDNNWRYEDGEGYISLSDAPEGEFPILVQTKNLAGEWKDTGIRTRVLRQKVFTQTALFQVLIYSSLGIAIFLYLWNVYHQRTRYYQLREGIANDLHDQVGSALTSISMKARMLSDANESQEMKSISHEATNALQLIRDTIWSVDPENDTLEHLIDRCKDFAYKAFESRYVEIRFVHNMDLKQKIKIDLRKELYLIFKEAITNSLKHASPTYIDVKLSYKKGQLEMTIENDGVVNVNNGGNTKDGLSLGLKSMQRRALNLGGILEYKTEGNTFEVSLLAPINDYL